MSATPTFSHAPRMSPAKPIEADRADWADAANDADRARQAPGADALAPSLFEPGRNCYRVGRANRVSFIVDGEPYFKAFVHAALRATRSLVIVGWDFHSRTQLHHGIVGVPTMLGDFLN